VIEASAPAATWEEIDSLVPWDKNPREDQPIEEVARSIEEFGFGAPLVARREGRQVIAGHTRIKALRYLQEAVGGWDEARRARLAAKLGCPSSPEILRRFLGLAPVRLMDLTEDQAKALALADNKLAELAKWDDPKLGAILNELAAIEIPPDLLGWSDKDADRLRMLANHAPGTAPPAPQMVHEGEPISKRGEVYRLGPHVLVCGSSADPAVWAAIDAIRGERGYDLVWTDPPYGVSYASIGRSQAEREATHKKTKQHAPIENDELTPEQLEAFLESTLGPAYDRTDPGGAWYVAAPGGPAQHAFGCVLTRRPTLWRQSLVWEKDTFVFGRSDRHYRHETIFYGWKEGAGHVWTGGRKRDSVLVVPRPKVSDLHPTEKPVELIEECLICHQRPAKGELVLDTFGGSGSTLVAAARLGMVCHTIEFEPMYADVIRERWARLAIELGQDPGPDAILPKA
jgi:DNA modification methylase